MKSKIYKYILIIMFSLPLFLFLLFPIRGIKKESKIESRTLETIPRFSLTDFKKGVFQDKLESAISDQLLFSQSIRKFNKKIDNLSNNTMSNAVKSTSDVCDLYVEVSGGYYFYGCSDYLIEKPTVDNYNYDFSNTQIKSIFDSVNIEKYIYFLEKDRSIIFNNISGKNKVFNTLKETIYATDYAKFEINSYEEYEKYFYQTDHHWNNVGSYKGYTEIAKLLGVNDYELKTPTDEVTYDVVFYGSSDRKIQTKISKEKFKVYEFEKLNYNTYINGVKKNYTDRNKYYDKTYSRDTYTNHYARYYGDDYAEVIFDYSNSDKENLLVLCTSYSNAIKDLLASHFNKTYYVDLRHYKDFDINSYIEKNNIDKVLLMGDITSFVGGGE